MNLPLTTSRYLRSMFASLFVCWWNEIGLFFISSFVDDIYICHSTKCLILYHFVLCTWRCFRNHFRRLYIYIYVFYFYTLLSLSVTCYRSVVFTGYSASSTNKTDRHDVTEILLKVALNTTNQPTNLKRNINCVSSQKCW
jgi:hypothetical protein